MVLLKKAEDKIVELVTGFGKDFVKKNVTDAIERARLQKQADDLLEKRFAANFLQADLEHEVDLGGLETYFKGSLIEDAEKYLYAMDGDRRGQIRKMIIEKLNQHMNSGRDAETLADNLLAVVKEFKFQRIEEGDIILAAAAVDEVRKDVRESKEEILREIKKANSEKAENEIVETDRITIKENRYEEYKGKWTENMFLNDFDPEEEGAGVNIPLNKVHILPTYTLNDSDKPLDTLENRMFQVADATKAKDRILLILGQPGVGKSSLITWFLNHYDAEGKREILVYRFSDFEISKYDENTDFTQKILQEMGREKSDLENKILFLDGFDEIAVSGKRESLINDLYTNLIGKTQKFSLFITCRENYVSTLPNLMCKYITIQPWNKTQIETFYKQYKTEMKTEVRDEECKKLLEKEKIFGIPLILYISLALDVKLSKESSVVDVYDRIFGKNGAIYERSIKRATSESYDDQPHRIQPLRLKIYEVSAKIAVWIFHNNPEGESIPQKYYKEIVGGVLGDAEDTDFFLGNYFKVTRHCEGVNTPELVFVHRSIYEYFVCEPLYNAIKNSVKDLTDDEQKTLAYNLVPVLKGGTFTKTIKEYLWHKLEKFYDSLDEDKKARFFDWLEDACSKMLKHGILYFADVDRDEYKNSIEKEVHYFHNYIGLLRIFFEYTTEKKYIMENANGETLNKYISILASRYGLLIGMENIDFSYLYLSGANLYGANLYGANLSGANLSGAKLFSADLKGANLSGANLSGAKLQEANLKGANLSGANLSGAKLFSADLRGANLSGVNLEGANLEGAHLLGANLSGANWKDRI